LKTFFTILVSFCVFAGYSTATDASMIINVEAGSTQTICYGETLNMEVLGASISGDVTDGNWFTMGDGIFLPSNTSNGVFSQTSQYQPGLDDLSNGFFTLILVSDDPDGTGPMVEVSDQVTINFMNAPALVCNNSINVSLADGCAQEVDVFMLLANPMQPYDKYEIELYDANGALIPNNTLTVDQLGSNIEFVVGHACTNNTCGGEILVNDNIAPFLNCVDTEVECAFGASPDVAGLPIPFYATAIALDDQTFTVSNLDACGEVVLSYQDTEQEMICASTGYIKEINRVWLAEDEAGNTTTCEQSILVRPLPLAVVMSPPDFDGTDEPPLHCDGGWDALPNGHPSPQATGMPDFTDCGNIESTYTDVDFEECGAGFKIVRQWFVIDWCTSDNLDENQVIKILDQTGPVFMCPEDLTLSSEAYDCASVAHELTFAQEVTDCSDFEPGYRILTLGNIDVTSAYLENGNVIDELPVGEYQLVYIATDVCGNATQCTTALEVIDDTAPFAVCDGYTQIALTSNGFADLLATSLDDDSFDNCGEITMEVAKMTDACGWGLDFGPSVRFCCEEVGDSALVAFRVTDAQGLSNTCMVTVYIEDKLPPVVECPTDLTVACTFDFGIDDLSVFGVVVDGESEVEPIVIDGQSMGFDGYFTDNCGASVSETSVVDLDCGSGTITRTFTITDLYDQEVSCTQTITIVNDDPFLESDIIWPANFEMNGCDTLQADPSITGQPSWVDDKCDQVASTYVDQYFFISGGACIKVLREWTVIDWCQYETGSNYGIWTYLQEIKLRNNIAPEFLQCQDLEVCSYDEDCTSELVTFTAFANDDCTDSLALLYLWSLDLDDDGSIDTTGEGIAFDIELNYGTHRVFWTVEDGCGNATSCDYAVEVRDCKNPTPYCISQIVTTIMPDAGMIEIWAEDFDFGSYDNCTASEDLIFSFSENINETSRTFHCNDIENGVAEVITLEMWVTDEYGNQDRCEIRLLIQDNGDVCPNGIIKGKVAGKVMSQHDQYIQDVELNYAASIDTFSGMEITDEAGAFSISATPENLKYVLRPEFVSDPNAGLSTLDLVLIQLHILEVAPFDNPYDIIAADVSGNQKISSSDLLILRKMILGIISEWPGETENWVFVDSSYVFQDESHPFYYPDSIVIDILEDTLEQVNFIGVKMGDVNGSYIPSLRKMEGEIATRSAGIIADITLTEEDADDRTYNLQFEMVDDLVDGLQFSLVVPDDAIIESEILNENEYAIVNNVLRVSWVNSALVDIDEATFLSISTKSDQPVLASSAMRSEIYLNIEAYPIAFENIALSDRDKDFTDHLQLLNIRQNPFITDLVMQVSNLAPIQIDVFDVQGRPLFSEMSQGRREIRISANRFPQSGVYIIRARQNDRIETHKVIRR